MILGIDYGLSHIGLALSEGSLASPLTSLDISGSDRYVEELKKIIRERNVALVVVGISEGQMGQESRDWGGELEKMLQLPVEFVDETLSSHEAGDDKDNHAKSAAIILQRYLDERR